MKVLGLETSCDETSAAVVNGSRQVLSNVIYSQAVHQKFGGVVPVLASREHIRQVVPIMNEALTEAGLTLDDIDGFAATSGPGLVGALLVGLCLAKALSFATGKPYYAVNHLEGHIAANLLAHQDLGENFLALLISGGHTMLIDVNGFGHYDILGKTLDDAAGEAFDKVAKLLGLGYPGGAALDKLAKQGKPDYFRFPRAVTGSNPFDFSYSGLKTAVALHIKKIDPNKLSSQKADIAASFQEAAVDMLCERASAALKMTGKKVLAISGGVAANSRLRLKMEEACHNLKTHLVFPPTSLCTDNAAMIAAAGAIHLERGERSSWEVNAVPYQKLA